MANAYTDLLLRYGGVLSDNVETLDLARARILNGEYELRDLADDTMSIVKRVTNVVREDLAPVGTLYFRVIRSNVQHTYTAETKLYFDPVGATTYTLYPGPDAGFQFDADPTLNINVRNLEVRLQLTPDYTPGIYEAELYDANNWLIAEIRVEIVAA